MRTLERRICSLGLAGLVLLGGCDTRNPVLTAESEVTLEHSVAPEKLTLRVGEQATITPGIRDKNNKIVNPRSLKWSTTNPDAATVEGDGTVTGLGEGESLIVASSAQQVYTTPVAVIGNGETGGRSRIVVAPDSVVFSWIGASTRLAAEVTGEQGTVVANATVRWNSLNPEVAQVDSVGNVTARSVGTALVVALSTCCADVDTIAVRVFQRPAKVVVSPATVSLNVGGSASLLATVQDSGNVAISGQTLVWESSDASIVAVSPAGSLTALKAGTASVTAKSGSISGTAAVTVGAPPTEPPTTGGGVAELPRVWVNTDWVAPTGKTTYVAAGGDLQAAINAAQRGDVIELQAGATYTGNYVLPAKEGTGWIVIRTRGFNVAQGTRVTPADAPRMAKLEGRLASSRVLQIASDASHYRIVGLEITYPTSATLANAVVDMSAGSQYVIVDRSYVHGHSGLNLQRCVTMHAEHGAVIDSYLSECHYKGADSQAIIAFNTPGPLKIVNNHLEGAGENVMFGGSTARIGMPSDIEIRGNYFYKPASWLRADGTSVWTVKNLFEIKFAARVLIEGNVFEGNWKDAQDGHAFNIKLSAAGVGDKVEDITIRNNILRRTYLGMKIVSPSNRVVIENNVLLVDGPRLFTLLSGTRDLKIINNTGRHEGNIITSTAGTYGHRNFVAQGNIWGSSGGYGVKGGGAEGTSTLNVDFPGWTYENNCHIDRVASRYPVNNVFTTEASARFDSLWRVPAGSPCAGLGANVNAVLAATAGVVR